MFTHPAQKPHVGLIILPPEHYNKVAFDDWEYDKMVKPLIDSNEIICTKIKAYKTVPPKRDVFDAEGLMARLPNDPEKPVFAQILIPSPNKGLTKSGTGIIHVNTAFIDSRVKKIFLNEPMAGTQSNDKQDILLNPEMIDVFKKKYPGYEIINENWQVQKPGENICAFVAFLAANKYATGDRNKLTREDVVSRWGSHITCNWGVDKQPSPSLSNFHKLLESLSVELTNKCERYEKEKIIACIGDNKLDRSRIIKKIFDCTVMWAFEAIGETYVRNAEFDEPLKSRESDNFKNGINQFGRCFNFWRNDQIHEFSQEGRNLIDKLFEIYKQYIDAAVDSIPDKTNEAKVLEHLNNYALKDSPLNNRADLKDKFVQTVQDEMSLERRIVQTNSK